MPAKLRISKYYPYLFLSISIIGYFIGNRQQDFSMNEFYLTILNTILATIIYFRIKKKSNYFDFDTVFITICILIGFLASFYYNAVFYKALFFYDFNYKYVNSGSWLFSIGMTAYYCGSTKKISSQKIKFKSNKLIRNRSLFYVLSLLIFTFIVTGGLSYYKSSYEGGDADIGITSHLLILILTCNITYISIEFINKLNYTKYKFYKLYFVIVFIFALLLMICGNRTASSQLILPILGLYAFFFKPIKLKYFICSAIPLFILMYIIQVTRGGESLSFQLESSVLMARDLTIPYRQTFVAMDYTDKNCFTLGESMTAPIIGAIPSLSRIIEMNPRKAGSSELLTDYSYKEYIPSNYPHIGLGTNTIADIYLCFSVLGVIVLMFFLGWFVSYAEEKAKKRSLIWTIVLGGLLANSIFLARSSYTLPIRFIIWGIVICIIYKSILYTKRKYRHSPISI